MSEKEPLLKLFERAKRLSVVDIIAYSLAAYIVLFFCIRIFFPLPPVKEEYTKAKIVDLKYYSEGGANAIIEYTVNNKVYRVETSAYKDFWSEYNKDDIVYVEFEAGNPESVKILKPFPPNEKTMIPPGGLDSL